MHILRQLDLGQLLTPISPPARLHACRHTAYHEAGHALVALRTPGASAIHKATIVPRGHALGMVTQVGREDEFSMDREQMGARIRVCMGGTVAEELVFGRDHVTSGATSDLKQVRGACGRVRVRGRGAGRGGATDAGCVHAGIWLPARSSRKPPAFTAACARWRDKQWS